MQTFWSRDNLYCITLNRNTKRFYIDFISDAHIRNGRVNVLYGLEYLTSWTIRNDAVLIALKNRNYIYISTRIIHFTMDEGDMVVRFIPSLENKATVLLTRYNTIYFNENVEMFYLIDKTISRPPEINVGFRIDDEFNARHAMLYHNYTALHNGMGLSDFILTNA